MLRGERVDGGDGAAWSTATRLVGKVRGERGFGGGRGGRCVGGRLMRGAAAAE
jgi:hypothetical protein